MLLVLLVVSPSGGALSDPGIGAVTSTIGETDGLDALSGEGRFVAFWSQTDFTGSETPGTDDQDVFVYDRQSDTFVRASVSSSEDEANGDSHHASISRDGRYVAFVSTASNLVPDDTNATPDAFVRDLVDGTTERVSLDSTDGQVDTGVSAPGVGSAVFLSGDGRHVLFSSSDPAVVPGDLNAAHDVFVRDLVAGATVASSIDPAGELGNAPSKASGISFDGRYVLLRSDADNLVPLDVPGSTDAFLHDRDADNDGTFDEPGAGATSIRRINYDVSGALTLPTFLDLSGDGRHAVFLSDEAVLVRDLETDTTARVDVDANGNPANIPPYYGASIGDDGRIVAFWTAASNINAATGGLLVQDRDSDGNGIFDEPGGMTIDDGLASGHFPSLSGDGQVVFDYMSGQLLELEGVGPAPETLEVNTTADTDDGSCDLLGQGGGNQDCTLREAIAAANAFPGSVPVTVSFDIQAGDTVAPHTIEPDTPLPDIVRPVVIDGYSQPGSSENTLAVGNDAVLLIELSGAGVGVAGAGLDVMAPDSVVQGLVVNRFAGAGIVFHDADGSVARGNFVGTDPSGELDRGNEVGIHVRSDAADAIVGSAWGDAAPGDRNLVSGNDGAGIELSGSGARVFGNYVGTNRGGSASVPNGRGVWIHHEGGDTVNNWVGGPGGSSEGNVISGNAAEGLVISTDGGEGSVSDNTVISNLIGTRADGQSPLGNGAEGVLVGDSTSVGPNWIGAGENLEQSNVIAYNGAAGVRVDPGSVGQRLTLNSIFSNGSLGIDLGNDGPTPNDEPGELDADTGANELQNAPAVSAGPSEGSLLVELDSAADGLYRIELFSSPSCDPSGRGEGRSFLTSVDVTTDGSGHAEIEGEVGEDFAGGFVTATATDVSGNTSEFSACVEVAGVVQAADVSVTKADSADPTAAGSQLTYTLTVDNAGPADATAVLVTDTLPDGVSFVSASRGGSESDGVVTWDLGTLAAADAAVELTLVVDVDAAQAADLSNTAHVSTETEDDNSANDSDVETTAVDDVTPPVIDPPADPPPGEATGPGGRIVVYTPPTGNDVVDGAVTVTCVPPPGSLFPVGETEVECTATDEAGNESTVTFTVTVEDTTGPVIAPPADPPPGEATGPGGRIVVYTLPTGNDAVDGAVSVTCVPPSGSLFPVGETEVECTATDEAGNESTVTFTVTVEDTTAPALNLPGPINRVVAAPEAVTYTASASDVVDGSVPVTCTPPSGSVFPFGATVVQCAAEDDAGNRSEGSFTVTLTQVGRIVVVKDAVPNDPQDFSFTAGGGLTPASFQLDDDGDAALSNTRTFTVAPGSGYTLSEAAVAGWVQTSATCSDGSPVSNIVVAPGEVVTCTFVNTDARADVSVSLIASPNTPLRNEAFAYTATVTNAGPGAATGTTLSITPPPGVTIGTITAESGTCTAGNPITCNLGTVAAGASVGVRVNATSATAGAKTASASVATSSVDGVPANNQAPLTHLVTAPANVFAMGNGCYGQLDGSLLAARPTPTVVPGLTGVTAVSVSASHGLALRSDGTVVGWGQNANGEVGDGTKVARPVPVPVAGLTGVTAVAAGGSFSVALRTDGTVWTWGSGWQGKLGDGAVGPGRSVPGQVPGLTGVIAIVAGNDFALALKSGGTVWSWGANAKGQLGNGTTQFQASPVQVMNLSGGALGGVTAISASGSHAIALRTDRTVRTWGWNGAGQLGDGTQTDRWMAVSPGVTDVVAVAAGNGRTVVAKTDGSVWQLSNLAPAKISGLTGITALSSSGSGSFSLARRADGTLWGWGDNRSGQLGLGTLSSSEQAAQVTGAGNVGSFGAGSSSAAAVRADGSLLTWGWGCEGQLGRGETFVRTVPTATSIGPVTRVAAGGRHGLALRSDGTVVAWGENGRGELGSGPFQPAMAASPVPVAGVSGVVSVAAGGDLNGSGFSLALRSTGTVTAWGWDYDGSLGDGPAWSYGPTSVANLDQVVGIATGVRHALAVRADGSVWAWGDNHYAQTGAPPGGKLESPVRVSGVERIVGVAAGGHFGSYALRADGSVWAWGYAYLGQGMFSEPSGVPARIPVLDRVVAIAGTGSGGIALRSDGTVWQWDYRTPWQVQGIANVVAVTGGAYGGFQAIQADGTLWAWGNNWAGEIGDGGTTSRAAPVKVQGLTGVIGAAMGSTFALALTNEPLAPLGESTGASPAAGGTVTTDTEADGATPVDPLETSVTTPFAGPVSIAEQPGSDVTASGYQFLSQQVTISAPAGTAASPLRIAFTIDVSQLPYSSVPIQDIGVFRNGRLVPPCTGAAGTASPDPCVTSRETLAGGDVRVTVLTSAASLWSFGVLGPIADPGGPYTVAEGSSVGLDGSRSSGAGLTYSWSPAGLLTDPLTATPLYTGVDDGLETATLAVVDANGVSDAEAANVAVVNVPPDVDLVAPGPGGGFTTGIGVNVTATFTDPGALDTHTCAIDWGDGTVTTATVAAGACTGTRAYAQPGPRTITVAVTDDDGGRGAAAVEIQVAPANPCAGAPPPGAIVGGPGNNTINGTNGDDVIYDLAGNNTINGRGGHDLICTGPGDDRIDGGAGNDTVFDTGGRNDVRGGDGADVITTGNGDDTVDGGDRDDTVSAGNGRNIVKGGDGADWTVTGAGDDAVEGGAGKDTVVDTGGRNTVKGGDGADAVTTGDGDDTVDGGGGDDIIEAGNGKNTVRGEDGADSITTGTGNDAIDGGKGFDTCAPGTGSNTVRNCESIV